MSGLRWAEWATEYVVGTALVLFHLAFAGRMEFSLDPSLSDDTGGRLPGRQRRQRASLPVG